MISLIFYILCPYTFVCFVIFYFYGSTSLISLFFCSYTFTWEASAPHWRFSELLNCISAFFKSLNLYFFLSIFFSLFQYLAHLYFFFSIHPFLSYLPNQSIIISLYGHFFNFSQFDHHSHFFFAHLSFYSISYHFIFLFFIYISIFLGLWFKLYVNLSVLDKRA